MSAYVNRLIDRFSPTHGDKRANAEPFVRSHSPIADFDQRPGGEESLGFEGLSASEDSLDGEAAAASPSPARIQRKAIGPSVSAALGMSTAPSVSPTPIGPSPVAPIASTDASPVAPIASTDASAPTPTPRREPMDPGPLFDIVPRYFDTSAPAPAPAPAVPSPATPDVIASHTPSARERVAPGPARGVTFEREPTPLTPVRASELELRAPDIDAPRPAPWQPIEPNAPDHSPAIRPLVSPAKARERELSSSPTPSRASEPERGPAPRHYAAPRPPAPAAYVPDPGPHTTAEPKVASRPRVHIGQVEIEVVPSNPSTPAQSGASAPKQRLSIDSISQIGPLGQHFPSRRRLRLRYR